MESDKLRIILYKTKCGWIGNAPIEATERLTRAIRFNHKIIDIKTKLSIEDPKGELNAYSEKTTQLTLPARFGMYKNPTKDVPKTTKVELDDIPFFADSDSSRLARNPNHKKRSIFN